MYRVASARNRYRGTARRSRKSSNRYLRMAQRMRQDGIGAVDGPITPPLRGSRRSRAARRRLMRWGANQRLVPRLQHIHTGVGALLFPVFVGCRSHLFPPTGSPAGCGLVLPTPPQGGSDSQGCLRAALLARSDCLGLRISMPSRCQFALRPSPHKFVAHPNHLHS